MEHESRALSPLGLSTLLDETFSIYGTYMVRWFVIAALVQVPIGLITTGLGHLSGDPMIPFVVYVLGMIGAVLVYGAIAYGVEQHYVTGEVATRECYTRVWRNVRSLILLALVPVAVIIALALPLRFGSDLAGTTLVLLLLPLAVSAAVYWSMAVPTAVIEGKWAMLAIIRSFALVRGSWMRGFGVALTLVLIALGMAIVVSIPTSLATEFLNTTLASRTTSVVVGIGDILVSVIVPPVLLIAWTLLYNDLRVRKEGYDVSAMSNELGIEAT